MLFKLVQKGFLVFLCTFFLACEEEGQFPLTSSTDVLSVDQLMELASNINFVGTMPNGRTVNFALAPQYSKIERPNYAGMDGLQFTPVEGNPVTINPVETNGFIDLTNSDGDKVLHTNFEFVYCNTHKEIRLDYPQLNLDPQFDHYEIIVAIRFPDHTILDYFENKIVSEHYLVALYSPNYPGISGYFQIDVATKLNFSGSFSRSGRVVKSNGEMNAINLQYEFELNCPN